MNSKIQQRYSPELKEEAVRQIVEGIDTESVPGEVATRAAYGESRMSRTPNIQTGAVSVGLTVHPTRFDSARRRACRRARQSDPMQHGRKPARVVVDTEPVGTAGDPPGRVVAETPLNMPGDARKDVLSALETDPPVASTFSSVQ